MAPKPFFLQFKPLSVLIKFSFRLKRKRSPPTTSIILSDSSAQDVSRPSSEKVYSGLVVDFNPDMWLEILSYCEVIDIVHVSMVLPSHYIIVTQC